MRAASSDRGQTLHDFAIGMVIFLLVLGYVFAFIPGLFSPFSPESHSSPVRVDRTADFLTGDLLASEQARGWLNASCTRRFFNTSVGDPETTCNRLPPSVNESTVRDLTGLSSLTNVNVSMVRSEGPAADPTTGKLLAVGSSPAGVSGRVIRAVRVVTFDGRHYRFIVRLW